MLDTADHERIFIALGSNLGDRAGNITAALAELSRRGVALRRRSSLYETLPVGGPPGQANYFNAVAELAPDDPAPEPAALLNTLLDVERALGRRRTLPNAPRLIDLDLLLYGARILASPTLILPHPRLHQRGFVLAPLAEIAPDLIVPIFHRPIRDLLADLGSLTGVLSRFPSPAVGDLPAPQPVP